MRKKAMLWEKLSDGNLRCDLCGHYCKISPGNFGRCGVRQNIEGRLFTCHYGKIIAKHVDPIEKKPLYHFFPGSRAYSIAAPGCNFRCSFCQNWDISQQKFEKSDLSENTVSPEVIVKAAKDAGCRSIAYTYTEPTIFFEYAYDTAKIAKENGLYNSFITNGFMTKEAIEKIAPYLDAANIDLKFFTDEAYKRLCGGKLEPVLGSIRKMKKMGIWVEVTTLVIPGENDSDHELRGIASFLAEIDTEMPWHLSRFYPAYKYTDLIPTPAETIERAISIGKEAGLKYIYPGNINLPADTICPDCGAYLISRNEYITEMPNKFNGECAKCDKKIKGIWI